jgi:ABC-type branched-subunit amino acid transport system substrate-binding protein
MYFKPASWSPFKGSPGKVRGRAAGNHKAAIFRDADDDYAAAVSQTFSDKMVQLTADENAIATVIEYSHKQKDFSRQIQAVQDAGAKVVLLASKTEDAIRIMKQAKDMGAGMTLWETGSWEKKASCRRRGGCGRSGLFHLFCS